MSNIDEAAKDILNNQQQSNISIEQAAQEILSSQQSKFGESPSTGSFGQPTYNIDSPDDNGSGANFIERLYLGAFADDKGKEKYFRDKGYSIVTRDENNNLYFGNSTKDLKPFDPKGLENDVLGEAADLIAQIPQIGASMIGGTIGAVGGPPGAIAGAGAGAGLASLGMKGIGKSLGLNTQDPLEVGTDVLIESIAGAAGQGLGEFLKSASVREVAKKSFGLFEKQLAKEPLPTEKAKTARFIAKLFNVTSGVPEDKTLNVFKYGADQVFEKGAGSPERLLNIVDELANTVTTQERNLGQALGAAETELLSKAKAHNVNTAKLQESVLSSLKELGLIGDDGLLTTKNIGGDSEQTVLVRAFEKLNKGAREVSGGRPTFDSTGKLLRQERIPVLTISPNSEISANELLTIRKQLLSVQEKTNDNNFKRILGDIMHGNQERGLFGIADEVANIASKVGDNSYIVHRKAFANYKSILDNLTSFGLNPKTNKLSIENLTKGSTEMAQVLRREMSKLDSLTGANFLKKMDIWDTAQAFTSTNPNFLRFNTVAGLLGGGALVGGRTPEEKALGGAGALLLGTPAGVRLGLKAIGAGNKSKISSGARMAGKSIRDKMYNFSTQKATLQTLSRLAKSQILGNKPDNK